MSTIRPLWKRPWKLEQQREPPVPVRNVSWGLVKSDDRD